VIFILVPDTFCNLGRGRGRGGAIGTLSVELDSTNGAAEVVDPGRGKGGRGRGKAGRASRAPTAGRGGRGQGLGSGGDEAVYGLEGEEDAMEGAFEGEEVAASVDIKTKAEGEEENDDEDNEDDEDDAPGGTTTINTSLFPMTSTGRRLTLEEEISKYIVKKGRVFTVSIIVAARQRYLGTYSEEEEAKNAFVAAYKDREKLITIVTNNSEGGPNVTPADPIKLHSKFKGKISRDVKLSDGSFISQDYYRTLDDQGLCADLRSMLYSVTGAGKSLTDWMTTHNPPPVFAQLLGKSHGTGSAVASLPLPSLFCVLGRATASVGSMVQVLGGKDSDCAGTIFDIYAEVDDLVANVHPFYPSLSTTEIYTILNEDDLVNSVSLCAVHLSFNPSIALQHAVLVYHPHKTCFQILALQPIFVDGKRRELRDGYITLNNRSIVQIGTEIFYFQLPTDSVRLNNNPSNASNLHLRSGLLRCMLASLPLRVLQHPQHFSGGEMSPPVNVQAAVDELCFLENNTFTAVALAEDRIISSIAGKVANSSVSKAKRAPAQSPSVPAPAAISNTTSSSTVSSNTFNTHPSPPSNMKTTLHLQTPQQPQGNVEEMEEEESEEMDVEK
jgi:hypothetical protein